MFFDKKKAKKQPTARELEIENSKEKINAIIQQEILRATSRLQYEVGERLIGLTDWCKQVRISPTVTLDIELEERIEG